MIACWGYITIKRVYADTGTPDTPETQAVKDAVQHSYTVFRGALRNGGDVSEFDRVFIDTDDYKLPILESRKFIEVVYGNDAAAHAGYLTAMKAKYHAMGKSVRMYEDVQKVAVKENCDVTAEELLMIKESCYGILPPSLINITGKPADLTYKKIEIQGDRAIVRYDVGAALQEVILILTNGQWRIASIIPVKTHF